MLPTLVHEMTHLEQHHFGTPSRRGYHNREWVGLMEVIGLIPSNTGLPGGKQTGQQMTHYTQDGGSFDLKCSALLADGFTIPWHARTENPLAAKKRASKTKYTCPSCGTNAWAKPETAIILRRMRRTPRSRGARRRMIMNTVPATGFASITDAVKVSPSVIERLEFLYSRHAPSWPTHQVLCVSLRLEWKGRSLSLS